MKFIRPKRVPAALALLVLTVVCALRAIHPDFPERLERMTYDWRVRIARNSSAPTATNLAFVSMEDSTIKAISHGLLAKRSYGLYWPRHIYGRVVEELSAQGAKTIAFDVLFGELRPDHAPVALEGGRIMESDDFFAQQLRWATNVITAFTSEVVPPDLFATNSLALGDISTDRDPDGVLRRIRSYSLNWHPAFRTAARELGLDLAHPRLERTRIVLPIAGTTNVAVVPLDKNGDFDLAQFVGDDIPKGLKRYDQPFQRVWDLGIVMAAQELKLDLDQAIVDLAHGRIVLRGPKGLTRTLPVDADGFFYINWQLTPDDVRLMRQPIETVLQQDMRRLAGETKGLRNDFAGRLVVIGSAATGNDLSDHGATPLENDTLLVSKHWNVANSVITGQFIHRASLPLELAVIILLAAATAMITWQLRAVAASLAVLLLLAGYAAVTVLLFVHGRWWLPLVYPLVGAVALQHFVLVIHQVMFEEREKRRVRSVFSKLVSPNIVNELLAADHLALGGARREVTVFFADVRGFTALTDQTQDEVATYIRQSGMDLAKAEEYVETSAREMLETVNLYLAAVADVIKHHGGTLDKFMGDCVMAFWNAPTPNDKHALACVQAAIDAQRAIQALNEQRRAENPAREAENQARLAAGQPPRSLHRSLQLGTGINTGFVTVGLMGSDQHILNYTVFGREVNLASRLEGESGSGRIIISDTTYNHLLRSGPALAATCAELFPVKPKGFTNPVRIYEVPWRPPGSEGSRLPG